MSFFISDALAQGAGGAGGGNWLIQLIPIIAIIAIFYFLLFRPQMKRAKEHKQMVADLAKGDEVITGGGMLGRITLVGDTFITLEVAPNTEIRLQKHAVTSVMPKGTFDSKNSS